MNGRRNRAHFPPWASASCLPWSTPSACSSAEGERFFSFLLFLNMDLIEVLASGSFWWNAAWSLMRHLARDRSIRLGKHNKEGVGQQGKVERERETGTHRKATPMMRMTRDAMMEKTPSQMASEFCHRLDSLV